MTVRIPDDLAAFVDRQVADGAATNRAAAIGAALRHERRRITAERDAAIYATRADDDDFTALAAHAAALPTDLD